MDINNINCCEPCPLNMNLECETPGFTCFRDYVLCVNSFGNNTYNYTTPASQKTPNSSNKIKLSFINIIIILIYIIKNV